MSGHAQWFRMGNIKKWGGPMPDSFLEQQHALQLQILPRLQSLGIIGGKTPQSPTQTRVLELCH